MLIKTITFIKSATKPAEYPPAEWPEIAFAGRSNVGKSSLINRLVNRKKMAKISCTPGRTQLINFFFVNECLMLVDLPGYGYAKVPAEIRKQWKPMIETYFSTRPTLKSVILIFDIRRTPGIQDIELINWLKMKQLAIIPVITKADKLSRMKQIQQKSLIAQTIEMDPQHLFLFSAKTGMGRDLIWEAVNATCAIGLNPSTPANMSGQ